MASEYPYLFLILGFALLAFSGNFLVNSSVSLSKHLKISTLVIGIVVVSFGTSSPELIVSLKAALDGLADMSLGNVVGSNISNVALVLAMVAIILPIYIKNKKIWFDWLVMIIASVILFLILIFFGEINIIGGIVFTSLLVIYIVYSIIKSRKATKDSEDQAKPKYNLLISVLMLIASCVGLFFGADFLIDSASEIARSFNVSERIISLTVIAFGTSVPELAASIIAALKKEMDISIGNIIGSNLFNILAILGITSIISPIKPLDIQQFFVDIIWMIAISAVLIIPILMGEMKRWKGAILLVAYIIYVYLLFNK
jgi:cation:H+ antiporter